MQHQLSNIFLYSFPEPQYLAFDVLLFAYPLEYKHPIELSQYHFQLKTQVYVCTTFHILLLHTFCIRPNGYSNIPYCVFSCTLSVLTYCNHSLCAEHSLNVFHITYIYSHDKLSWCLRFAPLLLRTSFLFPVSNFHF